MEFLTKIHLGAVIATMLQELSSWSWEKPFCVAIFAFFWVGCIPQFLLLRMKWKSWLISALLGGLIILCELQTIEIYRFPRFLINFPESVPVTTL